MYSAKLVSQFAGIAHIAQGDFRGFVKAVISTLHIGICGILKMGGKLLADAPSVGAVSDFADGGVEPVFRDIVFITLHLKPCLSP